MVAADEFDFDDDDDAFGDEIIDAGLLKHLEQQESLYYSQLQTQLHQGAGPSSVIQSKAATTATTLTSHTTFRHAAAAHDHKQLPQPQPQSQSHLHQQYAYHASLDTISRQDTQRNGRIIPSDTQKALQQPQVCNDTSPPSNHGSSFQTIDHMDVDKPLVMDSVVDPTLCKFVLSSRKRSLTWPSRSRNSCRLEASSFGGRQSACKWPNLMDFVHENYNAHVNPQLRRNLQDIKQENETLRLDRATKEGEVTILRKNISKVLEIGSTRTA
jgi:hypothetical protein